MAGLLLFGATGCITVDLLSGGPNAPLEQSVVQGTSGPKILLVEIDGMISGEAPGAGFFPSDEISMVARVREVLDRARQDDEIRGVLVRIDSPGGTATASEQIYSELRRFKQERGVPVVAQFLQLAASGGYYVAMAADEIQAHPTSVLGSIGVIFSGVNAAELMDKIGVEDQTIKGGRLKDMGSLFRPLSAEERGQLQSIVDELHARFKEVVDAGRPNLTSEQIDVLADGRIYSARQGLENGLVDRIGALPEAIGLLSDRMGAPSVRVVTYHRPNAPRRNIYMKAPASGSPGPLAGAAPALPRAFESMLARPGFHYLWWPGVGAP